MPLVAGELTAAPRKGIWVNPLSGREGISRVHLGRSHAAMTTELNVRLLALVMRPARREAKGPLSWVPAVERG